LWSPIATRGYPPFYKAAGLGWTLAHYEDVKTVSYGGGGFGWMDFLILMSEKNRAAVNLSNEESSAHEQTILAGVHATLERETQAGASVSWPRNPCTKHC